LCRPLCRPRAFLLLSLSTAAVVALYSLILSCALLRSRLLLLHLLSSSVSFLFRRKGRTAFLCRWKMRPRRASGRRRVLRVDKRKRERERGKRRISEREWRKKDGMREESVMRSLNTRVRYIVGKGETKKTRSRRRTQSEEKMEEEKDEEQSSSMNWMERSSSTRKELVIGPSQPVIRFLRREILQFQTSLAWNHAWNDRHGKPGIFLGASFWRKGVIGHSIARNETRAQFTTHLCTFRSI